MEEKSLKGNHPNGEEEILEARREASCGSTVAKHSIHNPKIVGLNPSPGTRSEKMVKIVRIMACSYSTLVEPMTSDREVEGSNPGSNWHQKKRNGRKKFERKSS